MESFNKRIYVTCNWTACTYGVIEGQKKKDKRKEKLFYTILLKRKNKDISWACEFFELHATFPIIKNY